MLKVISFKPNQIPKICGATKLGIRVDINVDQWGNHAANYPVYYTLLDEHMNNIAGRVKQTSNIFENLDPGDYYVKVENFLWGKPYSSAYYSYRWVFYFYPSLYANSGKRV